MCVKCNFIQYICENSNGFCVSVPVDLRKTYSWTLFYIWIDRYMRALSETLDKILYTQKTKWFDLCFFYIVDFLHVMYMFLLKCSNNQDLIKEQSKMHQTIEGFSDLLSIIRIVHKWALEPQPNCLDQKRMNC